MLVSVKPGADFSRECANSAMQPPIPATHPHLQRNETGALAMGLRPEEDHVLLYRGRRFSLG
jgi:hypothetical protein